MGPQSLPEFNRPRSRRSSFGGSDYLEEQGFEVYASEAAAFPRDLDHDTRSAARVSQFVEASIVRCSCGQAPP